MNAIRVTGEIVSELKMSVNKKKGCPQVSFLTAVPFEHPTLKLADDYRAYLRTYVFGEDAEWIYDNLYEGAHIEIRKGFVQTWYMYKAKTTFYRIVGYEIDKECCGDVPEDYKPYNVGRFSGRFRKQWVSDTMDNGLRRVGISIGATPDMKFFGTSYDTILSVILYEDLAEKFDGAFQQGDTIDYIEGVLESFRGYSDTWGVYVIATDIRV
jgi:hypothetical protein